MGKLRHISPQGYTIINNDCLKDKELDIEERGLLLTLVSLPDDWIFNIAGLCKILPCGKDKIKRSLQKLEEKDYLRRVFNRNSHGRYDSIDYITCRGCKIRNLLYADLPYTENPPQLNTNNDKINNVLNNNQSIVNESHIRQAYEKLIAERIDYAAYQSEGGYRAELVKAMYSVIVDSICSTRATLRINSSNVPQSTVKDTFLQLDSEHIEYVLEMIEEHSPDMTYIQSYLRTALYNAVSTKDMYYTSKLKADGTIP